MKKIIFIFLILFIIIPTTKAISKFHIGEKIPNMYVHSVSYIGEPFIIRRDDNKFVYSLEIFKEINENEHYKDYTYNDKLFNLTDEQLQRINLLGYYGYQYNDHTDIKWYGVIQFLIWKTLYNDVYFINSKEGNRINDYEDEINQLENLIENYLKKPSFINTSYEFPINTEYLIYDNNKVLDNYEVVSSDLDAYIKNNHLYIKGSKVGNYELKLIRKSPMQDNYVLYGLTGSQSLIFPGKVDDIVVSVNITISKGSITINKIDSESKKREFATLEGAEYGIYNYSDKLIKIIKTNKDGVAYIGDLVWDYTYYIKELKSSNGYKLDEKKYKIRLHKYEKEVLVNSYSEVINGNLIINKYYDNNLEDGAKFEIYDINDKLIGTYETEDGIININLEYGKYYAIQVAGIENYNYVDKFNINIEEEKDYVFDLYSEKKKEEILIVEVPNTKKIDLAIFISIIFIIVGLAFVIKSKKKTTR